MQGPQGLLQDHTSLRIFEDPQKFLAQTPEGLQTSSSKYTTTGHLELMISL